MSVAVERLSRDEQLMLDASRAWPQDIGALALLDGAALTDRRGRFRVSAVRKAIAGRLHLVPRLRQVIRVPPPWLGAPLWVDAPAFDLADHVRTLRLQAPAGEGELLAATETIRRRPLDPSRPLWEMWFLTGLADGRIGLFVRIHHALADGLAAMTIVTALMDRRAAVPDAVSPTWRPVRPPSDADLAADNLARYLNGVGHALGVLVRPVETIRTIRISLPALREVFADRPGSVTSMDRIIGLDRRVAVVRAEYRPLRRVARAHGATVNDVLLTATAAGLRTLLRDRGEPVDELTLPIYVPVSLRRNLRGPQHGTVVSQMVVPLALDAADPSTRLSRIAAETRRRKARHRIDLGGLFRNRLTTRLLLKIVMRQRVNVISASVPGPTWPLFLAGARVLEIAPVLPLLGNQPLGVGAVSYAGTIGIAVVADHDLIPDLDTFVAGFRQELDALLPARRSEVPSRELAPATAGGSR
jgi:WS/DGAT/MGAT family acyltransferase